MLSVAGSAVHGTGGRLVRQELAPDHLMLGILDPHELKPDQFGDCAPRALGVPRWMRTPGKQSDANLFSPGLSASRS